jgi:hypothetical protein
VTDKPTHDPHRKAQQVFLRNLRDARPLAAATSAVAETDQRGFAPDVAMLEVAITALDVAGVGPDHRLPATPFRQYLPEVEFKNQKNRQQRTRFAMYAATAIRSGLTVDLLDDTYWWQGDPLWRYALWAAVIYIRSCSELAEKDPTEFVEQLAVQLGLVL